MHCDGKLLPDITGHQQKVDRLPILVTGQDIEKLLGVPKLGRGTGEQMASVTVQTLEEWGMKERVAGMSFDTTSSNTGVHAESYALIEKKMERNLLYLACRHHMREIIVADVFRCCFGPTSGPDVLLFKRFKE